MFRGWKQQAMAGLGPEKSKKILENSRSLALGYRVEPFIETDDPRE